MSTRIRNQESHHSNDIGYDSGSHSVFDFVLFAFYSNGFTDSFSKQKNPQGKEFQEKITQKAENISRFSSGLHSMNKKLLLFSFGFHVVFSSLKAKISFLIFMIAIDYSLMFKQNVRSKASSYF